MKKHLIIFLAFIALFATNAQSQDTPLGTVQQLFDGMRAIDSMAIANCFHPDARLMSVGKNKNGKSMVHQTPVVDFVSQVGADHPQLFDEQLYDVEVKIDGQLATVWAPYTFYVDDKLSHCGTNAFQLYFNGATWKILQITDTRQRENCPEAPAPAIHQLMDAWHKAAATADEDVFFGSMTAEAVYLGTDDSERWLRDELKQWSAKYFDQDSAWDFTPHDRELYFAEDGKTAWFEEKLDTWMGPCRGSGVVDLTANGWKIKHYNLAMLVPNDKIDGFLKLIGKKRPKK